MEITRDRQNKTLTLSQRKYSRGVIEQFGLTEANSRKLVVRVVLGDVAKVRRDALLDVPPAWLRLLLRDTRRRLRR